MDMRRKLHHSHLTTAELQNDKLEKLSSELYDKLRSATRNYAEHLELTEEMWNQYHVWNSINIEKFNSSSPVQFASLLDRTLAKKDIIKALIAQSGIRAEFPVRAEQPAHPEEALSMSNRNYQEALKTFFNFCTKYQYAMRILEIAPDKASTPFLRAISEARRVYTTEIFPTSTVLRPVRPAKSARSTPSPTFLQRIFTSPRISPIAAVEKETTSRSISPRHSTKTPPKIVNINYISEPYKKRR